MGGRGRPSGRGLASPRQAFDYQHEMYLTRVETDRLLGLKKKYTCLELKLNKNSGGKHIFPLVHKFMLINTQNYFETISNLYIYE